MPNESRGNNPVQTAPVYTVYPGNQPNGNYGFYPSDLQSPPPKYEDVVNGKLNDHLSLPQSSTVPDSTGVVFIAPVYKHSKIQQTIGLVFTIIFLVIFVSVVIKMLRQINI